MRRVAVDPLELVALREFVMDRPEALDVLTPDERILAVGRLSKCSYQIRSGAELRQELGLSYRSLLDVWQRALTKLRAFKARDPHKCLHCDGKGWIDA